MNTTIGFIGTGNMGGALARAAAKTTKELRLADHVHSLAETLAAELGCTACSNGEIAAECGMIFLGVKPQYMAAMLAELSPVLAKRTDAFVLVSMAAGVTMDSIRSMVGADYPVIRIMPNTPVRVGSGMILFDHTENVTEEAVAMFRTVLAQAGRLDPLPERLIDAGCALTGCGPAFVDLFLEALADGAVACGLPRDKAMTYAAQMVMGSAQLALESGLHPGQLKDQVCSPGGSTIAGVRALEQYGFRSAVIEAVDAAYIRTCELGK